VKKKAVDGLSNLPHGALAEAAGAAVQRWTRLSKALLDVSFKSSSGDLEIDPFAMLRVTTEIRANPHFVAELGDAAICAAEEWARKEAQAVTVDFEASLLQLCGKHGISLRGRFPSYVLGGFLIVRVSQADGTCDVGNTTFKTLLVGRIWQEAMACLEAETRRAVVPEEFVRWCRVAYGRVVALKGERVGSAVPIRDLFRELIMTRQTDRFWRSPRQASFVEYDEEMFCRDLSKVIALGRFVLDDGSRMELMPTAFAKDGVPVVLEDGVRFFGRVAFSEPSK
jgi:hypothetical protein